MIIMKKNYMMILLAGFIFLGGCSSPQTLFVLLPDQNGNVGEIEITNEHGSRKIEQAGYAVSVKSGDAPPPSSRMADKGFNQIVINNAGAVIGITKKIKVSDIGIETPKLIH